MTETTTAVHVLTAKEKNVIKAARRFVQADRDWHRGDTPAVTDSRVLDLMTRELHAAVDEMDAK